MNTQPRLTASDRQCIECPVCGADRRQPCKSLRTPGANTLGGGWGGPVELRREHAQRIAEVRGCINDAKSEAYAYQHALESQID